MTEDTKTPLVAVVILNWNRPVETLECLAAVYRSTYPNFHVVIVDNGSQDDSVERVSTAYPQAKLLRSMTNLGYAGGNNLGLQEALDHEAEYILILNNDAFVEPQTLSEMVRSAEEDHRTAAVGCKVRLYEDPQRLLAAGECFERGAYPRDDGSYDTARNSTYAVGCCILLSRRALLQIGLLDEAYFLIHEEKDWCYRATRTGYRIRYQPRAEVQHKLSFTNQWSPAYHYLFFRNQLRFWRRYSPPASRLVWSLVAAHFWRQEMDFIYHHGEQRLRRFWAVQRGLIDHLRGHYGPPPLNL